MAFSAIELFSGGGGLSVGLKRAGFRIIAAVEVDPHAFSTFKANHPEVRGFKQDIRRIRGKELLGNEPCIDLIAGCPPCQGFSSLTSKYKKDDPRNVLVAEMTRIIREVRPAAVLMENVPGLATKGNVLFSAMLDELRVLGYLPEWDFLQVADFGVPQTRRRLVLTAGLGFKIPLPKPTHSRSGKGGLASWRTLKEVIRGMPDPITLDEATANGGPLACDWHVIRRLTSINMARLINSVPGKVRSQLPDQLRPSCHRGKDEGFTNVYGRMSWDSPSVTITGGCTTLSKGRFGHPEKNRTISVLEAALLQTFPRNYLFDTPYMEHVCDIIGNALPCDFAEILGRQVRDALEGYLGGKD